MKKKKLVKRIASKRLIDNYLLEIEKETGFHIINKEYGNGYFLFDLGKDNVCHFEVKEIPKFLFGIWRQEGKEINDRQIDNEIVLFSQPKIWIDKFKPSRCPLKAECGRYISEKYNEETDKWEDTEEIYDILNAELLLRFMNKHPYEAFQRDQRYFHNVWDISSGFGGFIDYYKLSFRNWKEEKHKVRTINKLRRKFNRNFKRMNYVNYFITEDTCKTPRIDVNVYVDKNISDKEYSKFEEKYNKFYDMIDKNNKYFMTCSLNYVENKRRFLSCYKYWRKVKDEDMRILDYSGKMLRDLQ